MSKDRSKILLFLHEIELVDKYFQYKHVRLNLPIKFSAVLFFPIIPGIFWFFLFCAVLLSYIASLFNLED